MRIMITGAGGFFGGHLTTFFSAQGNNEVVAVTRNVKKVMSRSKGLKVVNSETLDAKDMDNIDHVIHCAYPQGTDAIEVATGLDYTVKVLKLAREAKVKGFINISSQSIYGSSRKNPAKEDSTIYAGESIYTTGKYACELLTEGYLEGYVPYINIRMASLIGCDFGIRFINKFVQKAIAGEVISVVGGEQEIEFLDVRDAVEGLRAIIEGWENLENVRKLNMAGLEAYSISGYAKLVAQIAQKREYRTCVTEEGQEFYKNSCMDSTLMHSLIGWKPKIHIEQSIHDMFGYYESQE